MYIFSHICINTFLGWIQKGGTVFAFGPTRVPITGSPARHGTQTPLWIWGREGARRESGWGRGKSAVVGRKTSTTNTTDKDMNVMEVKALESLTLTFSLFNSNRGTSDREQG